mgnify:CR=1 FL=1
MKAKVTISRASNDKIYIRIIDSASRVEFAEVAMTVEDFGYAITGLSEQEGELKVRGLELVGKHKITEPRSIECPITGYDKTLFRKWLDEHAQEDGWMVNNYLGSQSSVLYKEGKTILNYSVVKYDDDAAA